MTSVHLHHPFFSLPCPFGRFVTTFQKLFSLIITVLTLFLKICDLQFASASADKTAVLTKCIRLNKSNKIQQYADIYLLLNYSTCLGRPSRPSSGVHKTVVAASGTDHSIWEASFFKCAVHVCARARARVCGSLYRNEVQWTAYMHNRSEYAAI